MELKLEEARQLAVRLLRQYGVSADYAAIVADHLVDAAMAGHAFAGLPRVLALIENLQQQNRTTPVEVVRETANSALIDGGNHNGYVTSVIGMDKAIELARANGVGIVGVRNTWFSGRLAYYVERAAREDLIAFHTATSTARVAPHGGIDRIFGTNPVAFAFPSDDGPVVVDFGTGSTTWGEVLLRKRTGRKLDPDTAVDPDGAPTDDPASALAGAILPWGGHRGSGLSLVVQILGILAGGSTVVEDISNCGFFFVAIDPALLKPVADFKTEVAALADRIRTSRPADGQPNVRFPGDASRQRRKEAQARGTIHVDDTIYATLMSHLERV
ncbi:Ldh family oxidoreductase [Oceanibacterium hippocampi]|uniref:Ureidoglycolate dehydrogenase (NAD(+)) n=1 Tax=Oceanibacterium hippocampi TaxID=745714 RepID=A0A1Y5SNV9_9PROT|nr:Ldh family oxidoreductase [Oceanibacterium hippocampi]SLN41931.1 Ureidoglycolate dehydrogenase (NAD(+)) [Oceanibacterium hippocampi]